MKISEDVRKYATEQGITGETALAEGTGEESRLFVEAGAEVYEGLNDIHHSNAAIDTFDCRVKLQSIGVRFLAKPHIFNPG